MNSDSLFMQRAMELANLGNGAVAPNPMVGAVIVHEGKIIGEGYHQKYGDSHAEVNAVNAVKNKEILSESTLYVTLEPCAHFGKTPPCAELIVAHRFRKVFVACLDPNVHVSGKGIQKIQDAGIDVHLGILENKCKDMNKRFFTFHEKKRPYIVLKWAQTKDGFIDRLRNKDSERKINWISSPETKTLVHQWRSQEQSILVGRKTIENDNPQLTVRETSGKNPVRILIDPELKISENSNIYDESSPTLVFNLVKNEVNKNIEWIQIANDCLDDMLTMLHQREISSVLVEGGASTLQHFIDSNLWDEARVIVGENYFQEGLKAPVLNVLPQKIISFSNDTILQFHRT
jgi:diaminohydroxyphosphoribosylaminopyrimidine deaminase / 5-amino-6-(5-phosphoribosylamino)uracil reductase